MKLRIMFTSMAALLLCTHVKMSGADGKLQGKIIGTEKCFDYATSQMTTTVNTAANVFDGNTDTFFATYERSKTWCGLDLGTTHVITRVGWSPRYEQNVGEKRVMLGLFEGANKPDFSDAVPIYIIPERGKLGIVEHADVSCGKEFRYVRYVGPNDARCNISEVEFYGHESEGEDNAYTTLTNLPTIIINTENGEEPEGKESSDEKISYIKIISPEGELLEAMGTIRLRGNASMNFEKHPYRIKFDKKQQLLDAPSKAKKWTLISNYGDKTLMRNAVAFELARRLGMEYVPYCRSVDVILNGEYKGCYQLCDQIEAKEGRVPIAEYDIEDLPTLEPDQAEYLIEIDGYAGYTEPFVVPDNWQSDYKIPITLQSPDSGDIKDSDSIGLYNYIKGHFQKLENLVNAPGFPNNGYDEYIDLRSFLTHFLIGEISCNTDTYWSVNMYKRAGDNRFYTGPEWDFDVAFDNDFRTHSQLFSTLYAYHLGSSAGDHDGNGWNLKSTYKFAKRIIEDDPQSLPLAKAIYEEGMNNRDLNAESIGGYIDRKAQELEISQDLNFKRWDNLSKQVHMNPQETLKSTYAEYIEQLKNFVSKRLNFLYNTTLGGVVSGVEDIKSANKIRVYGEKGMIEISDNQGCEVYALDGTIVYSGNAGTITLVPGIYIVRNNGQAIKVAVR